MLKKFSLLTCLALGACSDTEPTQTVAWYKEHAPERAEMLAGCRANVGERSLAPNCVNAQQAQKELDNARSGYAPLPSAN